MIKKLVRWGTVTFCFILLLLAGILIAGIYGAHNKLPLELWHTFLPNEMRQMEIDKADWDAYLDAEDKIFVEIQHNVVSKTIDSGEPELNRYNSRSTVYPENFADNWNRSYILHPDIPVKGSVVLLHGITAWPY